MSGIRIANGMKATYKNYVEYTLDKALDKINTATNCFEVLNDVNRLYLDIDGKDIEGSQEEFNEKDQQTLDAIKTFLKDESYCLMTSSSYHFKKISWRVVMINCKVTQKDNKTYAVEIQKDLVLPEGVTIDTGVYGANRKMRMLNSNKDNENRPLRLVSGKAVDTLITYFPPECELRELKESKKEDTKAKNKESKVSTILAHLTRNDYADWIEIGMVCYNEQEPINTWIEYSKKFDNFKEGECEKKWKTFTFNNIGIKKLWEFLKQDNPTIYAQLKVKTYAEVKEEFELTHFKLKNPVSYVRIYNDELQFLNSNDISTLYRNLFCSKIEKGVEVNKLFLTEWIADPTIRTYEKLVFLPKKEAPQDCYNLFIDFPCKPLEGDCSVPLELLSLICNKEEHVKEYMLDWLAHLIQKPYEKPESCIVVQGNQGVGKDTFFNFVGRMLGDYFYSTTDAERDVFCKFNTHLKTTILIKFEEACFMTNKRHADKLKGMITCDTLNYEGKGMGQITLDNYMRIVMTTNNEIAVHLEENDRRFILLKACDDKMGDSSFWDHVYSTLNKKETLQAFYHLLSTRDISKFNAKDKESRPKTAYYEEVKKAFIPYHAAFFQRLFETSPDQETFSYKARDLIARINSQLVNFDVKDTKFGMDMKQYLNFGVTKEHTRSGTIYTIDQEKMREFLKTKNWWNFDL
jgi:hypothetical protein